MTLEPPVSRALNVLLIEDSLMDVNLIRTALTRSEYQTNLTVFDNGEKALDSLHHSADKGVVPDMIISDLNLIGLDGWDVLRACKTSPYLGSIPIVVFTSTMMVEEISLCYALGANQVVTKPGGLTDFLKAVQDIENWARRTLHLS